MSLQELQNKVSYKLGLTSVEQCETVIATVLCCADMQSTETWEKMLALISVGLPLSVKVLVNAIKYPPIAKDVQDRANFAAQYKRDVARNVNQYRLRSK